MACERPDSRFLQDLADLNHEFIALMTHAGAPPGRGVFGLDAPSVELLARLSDAEVRYIAGTPCLLAGFYAQPPGVGEIRLPFATRDAEWLQAVRLFSVALLSFLRATMGRDRLLAAMCVGPERGTLDRFADISLGHIGRHASFVAGQLQARLAYVPSFWPDLIRAAQSDNQDFRHLSRLTAIPLVVAPNAGLPKRKL